ncbi:olfactory receptor 1D2-like [Hypomesus transpacificus]|uniref:olfactory receptor 1D2-like n=1 Tax=Hypomesus transpacificus TaxID=137520 RepID=UPI001F073CF4|nr:olfactory receptor 1D2-like [Hypomesus transpacificus]
MDNESFVFVFTHSGLEGTMHYRGTLFSLTLLCYCMILLVNIALILTIILDENLHEPMYIFLCNLCVSGLYGTVGFYPKFLLDLLSYAHVSSYAGCMIQAFVLYSYACCDFSILSVMAYDRYVAICRPLQYHSVMTKQRVTQLVSFSWFVPLFLMVICSLFIYRLRLCSSHIPKLYCANFLIAQLSCSATSWLTSIEPSNSTALLMTVIYLLHAVFIVCTYVYLVRSCLRSLEERGKFMQTCVPHLLSLFHVIVALLFDIMYMRYGSRDLPQSLQNFLAMEFLIVPPLLNPLIYGLKLTKIRNRILGLCKKKT